MRPIEKIHKTETYKTQKCSKMRLTKKFYTNETHKKYLQK